VGLWYVAQCSRNDVRILTLNSQVYGLHFGWVETLELVVNCANIGFADLWTQLALCEAYIILNSAFILTL
jgi:hypothetical protein